MTGKQSGYYQHQKIISIVQKWEFQKQDLIETLLQSVACIDNKKVLSNQTQTASLSKRSIHHRWPKNLLA